MSQQNKNTADIQNDCVMVSAYLNTILDELRVTLPDMSKKIDADNCGTISKKGDIFESTVNEIQTLSNVIDLCDNIKEAVTNSKK